MLFVARLWISWIWCIFQVLSHYRYIDWWERKVKTAMSAQQGETRGHSGKPVYFGWAPCISWLEPVYLCACVCVFVCVCVCVCLLSHSVVSDSATLWTVAPQAPLSMGFSRQEYWNGLPFPPPRDLPDSGIEPLSPAAPHWQADSLPLSHPGSPWTTYKAAPWC